MVCVWILSPRQTHQYRKVLHVNFVYPSNTNSSFLTSNRNTHPSAQHWRSWYLYLRKLHHPVCSQNHTQCLLDFSNLSYQSNQLRGVLDGCRYDSMSQRQENTINPLAELVSRISSRKLFYSSSYLHERVIQSRDSAILLHSPWDLTHPYALLMVLFQVRLPPCIPRGDVLRWWLITSR